MFRRSLPFLLALGFTAPAALPAEATAAPACAPAAKQVSPGAAVSFELDCDGADVVAAVGSAPGHGTADVTDGTVQYTNDGTGTLDRFTLAVRAAPGEPAATLTVEIGVGTRSRPSCGVPAAVRVRPNRTVTGTVGCKDSGGVAATSYTRTSAPALGTLTDPRFSTTGAFGFEAAGGEGETAFAFSATGAGGTSAAATQPLLVSAAVNTAPACQDRTVTVRPGSTRTLRLPCPDADKDAVVVETGTPTSGSLGAVRQAGEASDATVVYTAPTGDDLPPATFTFRGDDGRTRSAAATVTVTFDPAYNNVTPICSPQGVTLAAGARADVAVPCRDEEGDPLTYALVPASAEHVTVGAPVPTADGVSFPVTADPDFRGDGAGFSFTADDGQGGAPATVAVQITIGERPVPSCRAPARDALRSGRFARVDLAALCSGASGYEVVASSAANGRVVSATGNGIVEFQAAAGAADGEQASFSFIAVNDTGSTDPVAVTFATGPSADHPPVCSAPVLSHVRLGAARELPITCTDPDGDPVTATIAAADRPARGQATVVNAGRIRYAAPTDVTSFPLADGFTVTVTDGFDGGSVRVPVAVAVEAPGYNTVPSCVAAVPVQPRVGEARPVTLTCSDPEGDRITSVTPGAATGGTVDAFAKADDADDTHWVSRFRAGQTPGPAGFDYRVADEREFAPVAHVGLEVQDASVNAPPSCPALRLAAVTSVPVTVDPTGGCTDADGDALTAAVSVEPSHGTVTAAPNGQRYVSAADFSGVDEFRVTVDDGHGGVVLRPVTLDVARPPAPDPPPGGPSGETPATPAAPAGTGADAPGAAAAGPGAAAAGPGAPAQTPSAGPDTTAPKLRVTVAKARIKRVVARGLQVTVRCDEACTGALVVSVPASVAKRLGLVRRARKPVVIVRTTGTGVLSVRFTGRLARLRRVPLILAVSATDPAGNAAARTVRMTLRR